MYAQENSPVYAFSECKNVEEASLLGELNHITRLVFEEETADLDLAKIVADNWTDRDIDQAVNKAVDAAIEDVQREEGYWSKLLSAWTTGRAEEFAARVSTNAFDSPQFQGAMERLSEAVVDDLADEIQLVMDMSASSAARCVEEFVGASFSQTMAFSFDKQFQAWLPEIGSDRYQTDIEEVLTGRWRSGGVTILLGTQFTKLLAKKLAKGIVGKVVTRILGKAAGSWIPVIGWVIGGGLIAWDLWEARKGSLPQIGKALKGEEVKGEIRTQIVEAVGAELEAALPELSQAATIYIFKQWKEFLQKFEPVLRLAESNARFKMIMDDSTADQVDKLTELTAIGDDALGRAWLVRTIESGVFEQILALPKKSFVLLSETADPQAVLDWNKLAGDGIIRVVETKLYRFAQPGEFMDRDGLEKVLDIEEPSAVRSLMQLNEEDRQRLLLLSTAHIRWIFAVLSAEEINWLASYLQELPAGVSGILVEHWKKNLPFISKLQQSKDLRSKFAAVLSLAASNQLFLEILNKNSTDQIEKLVELHAAVHGALTAEQLEAMIKSGQFERILALPRTAFDILMQLNEEDRQRLLLLSTAHFDWIFAVLSNEEINWLVSYFEELPAGASGILVEHWKKNPAFISELQGSTDLRTQFAAVLSLAAANQPFLQLLNTTPADGIEKLVELHAAAHGALTADQLDEMIKSRQFERILALPRAAFDILKVMQDPALVLAWHDLASESIVEVANTGLYLYTSPTSIDGREELQQWLALDSSEAIRKLPLLEREHQLALLGLETDQTRSTLLALSAEDLAWLAGLLHELTPQQAGPLADHVLQDTTLVALLRSDDRLLERFPLVLDWVHDFPQFKSILEETSVEEAAKLTDLVTVASGALDSDQQLAMISSGQFETILGLPEPVFEILRVGRDPELAIDWGILAGALITQVVQAELHLHSLPQEFDDPAGLQKTLALNEPNAIGSLLDLEKEQRNALLQLPTEKARAFLLSDLPHEVRSWLAQRFLELPPADFALLIDYTLRDPSLVDELRNEAVGDALLASRNKQSALNFVRLEAEGPPSLWPTARMVAAAMPVLAGDLPWPLYWRYYSTPSLILLSLVVALIAVAVISVWFHRRRQRAMRTIDHRDLGEDRS